MTLFREKLTGYFTRHFAEIRFSAMYSIRDFSQLRFLVDRLGGDDVDDLVELRRDLFERHARVEYGYKRQRTIKLVDCKIAPVLSATTRNVNAERTPLDVVLHLLVCRPNLS